MKLCIDCKYYSPDPLFTNNSSYGRCSHPSTISLVDGKTKGFTEIERRPRSWIKTCGPKGIYWEAKSE